ncbi:hypothetical protein L5515_010144 [Caenorhabditis briggsae]|uniref:Chromo domain-containing protein n=3 Tax=Caenorhabditis briggsae TaxID=6238 RepID=A0AAE9EQ20_CAEBR|nr:hypothetical protein L5515_010144 [Caenorhabditis briggsae]
MNSKDAEKYRKVEEITQIIEEFKANQALIRQQIFEGVPMIHHRPTQHQPTNPSSERLANFLKPYEPRNSESHLLLQIHPILDKMTVQDQLALTKKSIFKMYLLHVVPVISLKGLVLRNGQCIDFKSLELLYGNKLAKKVLEFSEDVKHLSFYKENLVHVLALMLIPRSQEVQNLITGTIGDLIYIQHKLDILETTMAKGHRRSSSRSGHQTSHLQVHHSKRRPKRAARDQKIQKFDENSEEWSGERSGDSGIKKILDHVHLPNHYVEYKVVLNNGKRRQISEFDFQDNIDMLIAYKNHITGQPDNEDEDFAIDKILAHRFVDKKPLFLVMWEGYPNPVSHSELWEEDLQSSKDLLKAYMDSHDMNAPDTSDDDSEPDEPEEEKEEPKKQKSGYSMKDLKDSDDDESDVEEVRKTKTSPKKVQNGRTKDSDESDVEEVRKAGTAPRTFKNKKEKKQMKSKDKKGRKAKEPEEDEEEEDYVVERIVSHRVHRNKILYKVMWEGYPKEKDHTEMEEKDLEDCKEILQAYKAAHMTPVDSSDSDSDQEEAPQSPRKTFERQDSEDSDDEPEQPESEKSSPAKKSKVAVSSDDEEEDEQPKSVKNSPPKKSFSKKSKVAVSSDEEEEEEEDKKTSKKDFKKSSSSKKESDVSEDEEDEEDYVVEKIVSHRTVKNKVLYRVMWEGYPKPKDYTEMEEKDLKDCPKILKAYKDSLKKKDSEDESDEEEGVPKKKKLSKKTKKTGHSMKELVDSDDEDDSKKLGPSKKDLVTTVDEMDASDSTSSDSEKEEDVKKTPKKTSRRELYEEEEDQQPSKKKQKTSDTPTRRRSGR